MYSMMIVRKRLVLPILVHCIGTAVVAQSALAAEWLQDPITGCKIWGEDVDPTRDVATWTGPCENGKASGTGHLVWFEGDTLLGRYEGEMREGRTDGQGVLYYRAEGGGYDRFEGGFADGDLNGFISHEAANGDRFEGQFKDGLANGYGIFVWANGDRYDGELKDSVPHG